MLVTASVDAAVYEHTPCAPYLDCKRVEDYTFDDLRRLLEQKYAASFRAPTRTF